MNAVGDAARAAITNASVSSNRGNTIDTNQTFVSPEDSHEGGAGISSFSETTATPPLPPTPTSTPSFDALIHCWEPLRLALSRLLGGASSKAIADKFPFLFERAAVCLLYLWPVIADVPWPNGKACGEAGAVEGGDPSGVLALVEQLMTTTLTSEHHQELADRFAAAGLKRLQTLRPSSLNRPQNSSIGEPARTETTAAKSPVADTTAAPNHANDPESDGGACVGSGAGFSAHGIKKQWVLVLKMLSAATDHTKGLSGALHAVEVLLAGPTHQEAITAAPAAGPGADGGNSFSTLGGNSLRALGSITTKKSFLWHPRRGTGSKLCRANAQDTEVLLLRVAHCTEAWVGQYGSCSGRVVGALQSAAASNSNGTAKEEKPQSSSYFYGSNHASKGQRHEDDKDEVELPPIHPPPLLPTKVNLEQHARGMKLLALLVGRSSHTAEESSNAKKKKRQKQLMDSVDKTAMADEPFTAISAVKSNHSNSSSQSSGLLPPQSSESEAEVAGGSSHASFIDASGVKNVDDGEDGSGSGAAMRFNEDWCSRVSALQRWRRALEVLQEATELPYNDTVSNFTCGFIEF